jgi:hypothetical protein
MNNRRFFALISLVAGAVAIPFAWEKRLISLKPGAREGCFSGVCYPEYLVGGVILFGLAVLLFGLPKTITPMILRGIFGLLSVLSLAGGVMMTPWGWADRKVLYGESCYTKYEGMCWPEYVFGGAFFIGLALLFFVLFLKPSLLWADSPDRHARQ